MYHPLYSELTVKKEKLGQLATARIYHMTITLLAWGSLWFLWLGGDPIGGEDWKSCQKNKTSNLVKEMILKRWHLYDPLMSIVPKLAIIWPSNLFNQPFDQSCN